MKSEPLANYSVAGFLALMKANGPLWVIHNPQGDKHHYSLHALRQECRAMVQ